jgi:hypothetical protein
MSEGFIESDLEVLDDLECIFGLFAIQRCHSGV